MCKEMLVDRVVDKKRIIGKNAGPRSRDKRSCCPPPPKKRRRIFKIKIDKLGKN
jgi:hypothetical protein